MSMLSTFCTNSINILAGVNGVEVSPQTCHTVNTPTTSLTRLRCGSRSAKRS